MKSGTPRSENQHSRHGNRIMLYAHEGMIEMSIDYFKITIGVMKPATRPGQMAAYEMHERDGDMSTK